MHFRAYDDLENKGASIPVEERKCLFYKKKYQKVEFDRPGERSPE